MGRALVRAGLGPIVLDIAELRMPQLGLAEAALVMLRGAERLLHLRRATAALAILEAA